MSEPPPRPPLGISRDDDESRVITYAVPFAAALFVAVGIAGTVLGGWAIVQPAIGACDNPAITVFSQESTADRVGNGTGADELRTLEFDELTPAEQRAFTDAIEDPHREGTIDGDFAHREAFEQGVVITHEGVDRYATLASTNACLGVDPLALPLGAISLFIGLGAFAYLWVRFT